MTVLASLVLGATLSVASFAGTGRAASEAAPVNSAAPSITGTPRVGQVLTASTGSWSNSPTEYSYQWLRCNTSGGSCTTGPNGTQKYTLVPADAGHTIRVRVTASNADGSAAAQSEPTKTVAASAVPRNTSRPIVSGTPQLGQTLTTDEGSWAGDPTSFSFQWQRCEADNILACADIPGATAKTYTTRVIDVGYRLRL